MRSRKGLLKQSGIIDRDDDMSNSDNFMNQESLARVAQVLPSPLVKTLSKPT